MRSHLTKRQDNFIFEYTKDGNATQAAIRAGYSAQGAKVTGYRLLTNTNLEQRLKLAGQLGIDALIDIATNGTNELAQVAAARTLVELTYGKPRHTTGQPPEIRLNVLRVS
jgi:phage terminase small subunit